VISWQQKLLNQFNQLDLHKNAQLKNAPERMLMNVVSVTIQYSRIRNKSNPQATFVTMGGPGSKTLTIALSIVI
jgi:hypothetical protein